MTRPLLSELRYDGCCPACNRFVGPLKECPYCDTTLPHPPARRLLHLAATTMAIAGTLLIWLVARTTPAPAATPSQLTPAFNFARLHLAGALVSPPRVGKHGQWAKLRLAASGQRFDVQIRGAAATESAKDLRQLTRGDELEVIGDVRIRAGGAPVLYVRRADHVLLRQPVEGNE